MTRQQKIDLLQKIKSGKLPVDALLIEPGIYEHQNNGIYKNAEGYEIRYADLMKSISALPHLACTIIYFENKEQPYSIAISEAFKGMRKIDTIDWHEEKVYIPNEIVVSNEETAKNISKLINNI